MSLIKANNITNTTGGIPTVKSQQLIPTAWVNFNGTGTVAIRDSEGVSSISDNGVGIYTINFAATMANINYAASLSTDGIYNGSGCSFGHEDSDNTAFNLSNLRVESRGANNSTGRFDVHQYCVIILGGQA